MKVKILRAILAISVCLMPAIATAHEQVFYPRGACRIYVDTDLIRLPKQCGTTASPHIRARYLRRISGGCSVFTTEAGIASRATGRAGRKSYRHGLVLT